MTRISARFRWMVDVPPLSPDDRVLEVGCGHGVAVGLIGEGLVTGTVTGVDHSAKMITAATKRNAALIDAGRVRLRTASLHELDDDPESFDLICAMNVASFQTQPERDLGASRRLLALPVRAATAAGFRRRDLAGGREHDAPESLVPRHRSSPRGPRSLPGVLHHRPPHTLLAAHIRRFPQHVTRTHALHIGW